MTSRVVVQCAGAVRPTLYEIPGWPGGSAATQWQPWRDRGFEEAARQSLEFIWTGKDVAVEAGEPFETVSSTHLRLPTSIRVVAPAGHELLLLPHFGYCTGLLDTPLVLPARVGPWFPGPLTFILSRGIGMLREGQGFAQGVIVPAGIPERREMMPEEKEARERLSEEIGTDYNRLQEMAHRNQLPWPLQSKRASLIRRRKGTKRVRLDPPPPPNRSRRPR